ncbi:hypothetical protein PpBr36_01400 [Pyricularia pennisetigena]|uniref:hypothetical protein n=1 Tax=Pyricularia pennisetigena TaxID=1578925 RepID=UPI0011538BB6|nr:hypothetical protein PpBr36_01400 [Pyricularia pennisetigena]TLS29052.1 hypothetical protein PpBr36_01400 [Pyricularia pennisetigena]
MPSSLAVCVTEWCLWSVAVSAFSLRVFVRLRMRTERLVLSDFWLFMGLVSSTAVVTCDTMTFAWGYLEPIEPGSSYPETILKLQYATSYLFDTGLYFTKFSILSFYWVLVDRTSLGMRRALYALAFIAGGFWIATVFADTFWCGRNPSVNWIYDGVDECTVFLSVDAITLNWSFQFVTEVLIFLFPFPIIWKVQINHRARVAVYALLGLGAVTIMTTVGRMVAYSQILKSDSNDYRSLYIWATGEYTTSIVVVSLAGCRPILGKIPSILAAFKRTILHKTGSSGTDRTRTCSRSGGGGGGGTAGAAAGSDQQNHANMAENAPPVMTGSRMSGAGWRLSAHNQQGAGGVSVGGGSTRLSGVPRHWIDVLDTATLFGDDDEPGAAGRGSSRKSSRNQMPKDEEWADSAQDGGSDGNPGPSESEPTPGQDDVAEVDGQAHVEPRPTTGVAQASRKTAPGDDKENTP